MVFPFNHQKEISIKAIPSIYLFFFFKASRSVKKVAPIIHYGGPALFSRESREGDVRKHEDKNKPYTFPLFSPFETRNELCCFLCFCCIRDSLHPIQVKEERKKKLKLNKVDMKGGNKRWRKRRATARGIYSSNITPLMFPDME